MGVEVDREVATAVESAATRLAEMGHHVVEESPEFDGLQAMRHMTDVWFFGFDLRLEGMRSAAGTRSARTRSSRSRTRSTNTPGR